MIIRVFEVENHYSVKEEITNLIESAKEQFDLRQPEGFVSKSKDPDAYRSPGHITYADYFHEFFHKEQIYSSIIKENMHPYATKLTEELNCTDYKFKGMWYHEYHEGDSFDWHTHDNCHYTALYYLDGLATTELLGPYELDIKEGDVAFVPSMIPHRSPVAKEKRSVIAWTMNLIYKNKA